MLRLSYVQDREKDVDRHREREDLRRQRQKEREDLCRQKDRVKFSFSIFNFPLCWHRCVWLLTSFCSNKKSSEIKLKFLGRHKEETYLPIKNNLVDLVKTILKDWMTFNLNKTFLVSLNQRMQDSVVLRRYNSIPIFSTLLSEWNPFNMEHDFEKEYFIK